MEDHTEMPTLVTIVKILANDVLFCKKWLLFCCALDFETSIKNDLELLYNSHRGIEDITVKILTHWKVIAPTQANLETLCTILKKIECRSCAENIKELSKNSNSKIWNDDGRKGQWWPERKPLIKSLHRRRCENGKLFVEELHDLVYQSQTAVICESDMAAKYSGMGGVGKTLTAKWFAHYYEHEYDHILWIDCGEGSLVQSFKKLALELKVDNWKEYNDAYDFARLSHQILSDRKCLWIYDNAESYQETDGIQKVLPNCKQFHCLITSRSRSWGYSNGLGIPLFELNIFGKQESLEFLKTNLNKEISYTDHQLENLGQLLSHLPLALQLAVATLNNRKIDLTNYIEKTSSEDIENIVDTKFDDYEKTVNKNIKIALDELMKEKGGQLAHQILIIFGYISPDNVQSKFLMKVLCSKVDSIKESINLLEKYSLINKTGKQNELLYDDRWLFGWVDRLFGWDKINVEMDLLSIHRLLQQVIRHNGRKIEKETLRRILRCNGFVDYKFVPFTKYADDNLKKEFPRVKAELLDQEKLKQLFNEEKYEDCVQLAKFINDELQKTTTIYNYVVCLRKNGQLEVEVLKSVDAIFAKESKQKAKTSDDVIKALKILFEGLRKHKLRVIVEEGRHLMDLNIEPTTMEVGHLLFYSYLQLGDQERALQIGDQINVEIHQIIRILSAVTSFKYNLKLENHKVNLQLDGLINTMEFSRCQLDLSSFERLSPHELTLNNTSYIRNGQQLDEVVVNQFLDFKKLNRLILICGKKGNLTIDLSDDNYMEYIEINDVRVINWNEANWNIKIFKLNIPFLEKTQLKIEEMRIIGSSLDISCLPQTIEKLSISKNTKVLSRGSIELPALKSLSLTTMDSTDSLSHFHSVHITQIHFYSVKEINLDLLPESIQKIKITNYWNGTNILGELKKVDKLILEDFSDKLEETLSYFQVDTLVIAKQRNISLNFLQELMQEDIKTVAVGTFHWKNENFELFSKLLHHKAECYMLEGGKWWGINEKELEEAAEF